MRTLEKGCYSAHSLSVLLKSATPFLAIVLYCEGIIATKDELRRLPHLCRQRALRSGQQRPDMCPHSVGRHSALPRQALTALHLVHTGHASPYSSTPAPSCPTCCCSAHTASACSNCSVCQTLQFQSGPVSIYSHHHYNATHVCAL